MKKQNVKKLVLSFMLIVVFSLFAQISIIQASTLEDVKKRGFLQCGVSTGFAGLSWMNKDGKWEGLDVDVCRAIAAAIFNDDTKVRYTPTTGKDRFVTLQTGAIDVLSKNSTWFLTIDVSQGLNFAGINYYDGQGFIVRKSLNITKVNELAGASICVTAGTTTNLNTVSYFAGLKKDVNILTFATYDEIIDAYEQGRCDSLTADGSNVAGIRLRLKNPDEHMIIPETISKDPLGPVVRQGDDQWFHIVRWALYALISAEELGITQKNIDELYNNQDSSPDIKRFLGIDQDVGIGLGLSRDWAYNVIKKVGNYGESFERNLGMGSALKLPRGLNALWKDGGLQYSPPFR